MEFPRMGRPWAKIYRLETRSTPRKLIECQYVSGSRICSGSSSKAGVHDCYGTAADAAVAGRESIRLPPVKARQES
ncbi:hypothetical protein HZH68_003936 [Vespula germanica]|uniref:Uncharacterized protein n=1 Tax=Vespula germanica TaxID=30212 RepID=A0A834KMT9_VESGE|nr:hypothetical protein HZH68_003936 [Vespula germanica]